MRPKISETTRKAPLEVAPTTFRLLFLLTLSSSGLLFPLRCRNCFLVSLIHFLPKRIFSFCDPKLCSVTLILICDLDRAILSRRSQDKPLCQIYRSLVISFCRYHTKTQTHAHGGPTTAPGPQSGRR